ncbi:MAG: glutamine amidotransferase, partial [Chloroflexota bacterium]
RILPALDAALPTLADLDVTNLARHAVLLTDGKPIDRATDFDYYDVIDAAQEENITLSTIAIGVEADETLLMKLAERGRGRYHFAATPDELPALAIAESDILRSNALQEDDLYQPTFSSTPHPILRGFLRNEAGPLPTLDGYIAQTPKPQAEIALQVGPGDPLLTTWGYGLGRVAAWTSDIDDEWSVEWSDWPDLSQFWGQIVGYTLPAPNLGTLQLKATLDDFGTLTLIADSVTATGQPVDLAQMQAVVTTPSGRETAVDLRQVSPGRYQQNIRLVDPGAYQVDVTQRKADTPEEMVTIGVILPYPAEYAASTVEMGPRTLQQIATQTGGQTFSLGEPLNRGVTLDEQAVQGDLQSSTELWPWLLQVALILWPIEIAWRRWKRLRIQ